MENDAYTRDGFAGLWLCTDTSEPQYTSVIPPKSRKLSTKKWNTKVRDRVSSPNLRDFSRKFKMLSQIWIQSDRPMIQKP